MQTEIDLLKIKLRKKFVTLSHVLKAGTTKIFYNRFKLEIELFELKNLTTKEHELKSFCLYCWVSGDLKSR